MDSQVISTTAISVLVAYLVKAGEAAAQRAGQDLYQALKSRFERKPAIRETLTDLEKTPADNELQTVMRFQLKKLLEEDRAFAAQVCYLLQDYFKRNSVSISAVGDGEGQVQTGTGTQIKLDDVEGQVQTGSGKQINLENVNVEGHAVVSDGNTQIAYRGGTLIGIKDSPNTTVNLKQRLSNPILLIASLIVIGTMFVTWVTPLFLFGMEDTSEKLSGFSVATHFPLLFLAPLAAFLELGILAYSEISPADYERNKRSLASLSGAAAIAGLIPVAIIALQGQNVMALLRLQTGLARALGGDAYHLARLAQEVILLNVFAFLAMIFAAFVEYQRKADLSRQSILS